MAYRELAASADTVLMGVVDRRDESVLTIRSGDIVSLDTWNAWGNRVTPSLTIDDVGRYVAEAGGNGPHDLTGPIAIEGAQPGDVLQIDVIDVKLRRHGFNINLDGSLGVGLLAADVPEGRVRHYTLPDGGREGLLELFPGFQVPIRPFLGYMGVAPRDPGPHSSNPPGPHGGNIDVPDLTRGSTLFLPVWTKGALFSAGDAHAAQGYGEINLTCVEASAEEVVLQFTLLRGGPALDGPRVETASEYVSVGIDESLTEACRNATRGMVAELMRRFPGLDANDAYALCSIGMDLKVSQVVNLPNVGAQASIRKELLRTGSPWFSEGAGWIRVE